MTKHSELEVKLFKGERNDENSKNIPPDYLFKVRNYNYPDTGVLGLEKILMPGRVEQFGTSAIDGIFEYRYLDASNVLQREYIVVTGGTIYKTDFNGNTHPLKTGLTAGPCTFAVYNDVLYIANGKNIVQYYNGYYAKLANDFYLNIGIDQTFIDLYVTTNVISFISEMGAPFCYPSASAGTIDGTSSIYYEQVYTIDGTDEYYGAKSNKCRTANPNLSITVLIPFGITGTTARKIYRIATGYSDAIATTIGNNTDTSFPDTSHAGATGTPTISIADPKPYFITQATSKMFMGGSDLYPTQLFITETDITIPDYASGTEISAQGFDDNTSIAGIGQDFGKIIVGTGKQLYLVDPADNSVTFTRSNVGIKSGYSVQTIPAYGDFYGGMMFVSTLNDVRIMSGQQSITVSTTLDNVRTENWAQAIRGSLETELNTIVTLSSAFYKYKYHLALNNKKFVFDIRTQGWTEHVIVTENYESKPINLAIINNLLYNGQADGWIEQEYKSIQYRSEDTEAYIETPHIAVNSQFKVIEKIELWFIPSVSNKVNVTIITDDNREYTSVLQLSILAKTSFKVNGGAYNQDYFSKNFFAVDLAGMDYRVININKTCRWIKIIISNTEGNIIFQGFKIKGQELANMENYGG